MTSNGWFYNNWMTQTIRNNGGEVVIDNSEFRYNPIDSIVDYRSRNAVVWTEAPLNKFATTTIANSFFDGGWMAIENYKGTINSSITNNTFQNFQNSEGSIVSQYNFPQLQNNIFTNNASEWIDYGSLTLTNDLTLVSGINYLFSLISVPTSTTLTLEAGTVVTMKRSASIEVKGKLLSNGTAESPVVIKAKPADWWGTLSFQNSFGSVLNYTNITAGNFTTLYPQNERGMLTLVSSTVALNSVNLTEAYRPRSMVYVKNSQLDMKDGLISWSTVCTTCGSAISTGILSLGNSIINLDNTYFNRMHRGIEVNTGGTLTIQNMDSSYFQNISDLKWWPTSVWAW
jgi:hypothetical protein